MAKKTREKTWAAVAAIGIGALVVRALLRRESYSFEGKTVLITGGSRGLGLVLAREFAREGAQLVLCARDLTTLSRACDELADKGAQVLAVAADVTGRDDIDALLAAVDDRFGHVDVLVNNAGCIEVGPLDAMTEEDFERAMATHFWGPLRLMRAVIPRMRERGEGRIVNVVSVGGIVPMPHLVPYSASKFALGGLSEAMHAELVRDGVRITTVYPGLMRTGSTRNADFKGRFREEHAWFTLSDALPLTSISADRAARRIVNACRRGDARLVLSAPARLAEIARGLAPNLVSRALGLLNRVLPAPGGAGATTHKGYESESAATRSVFTALDRRAAEANNEVAPVPAR